MFTLNSVPWWQNMLLLKSVKITFSKKLMKTPHNKMNVGAQSNVWVVTFIKTIWDIDMVIVFLIDPRIRSIEMEKSNL